jgi:sugar-specific transcriptional regulator TrmB
MPANRDVLAEARQLVERRLADIERERERLQRALAELGSKVTRRSPGPPRGKSSAKAIRTSAQHRKRRGSTRFDEAVKVINASPGISASDVAKTMKIKPNYVYRVLGDLEKEGRVKKDGRKYFPASSK